MGICTTLQTLRSVEKEGGRNAPDTGVEIPQQPVAQPMVSHAVPLQLMKDHRAADNYLKPMEDPISEQLDVLCEGGCDPMGNPHWSSWQDLWPHGKMSPLCSRFARTCEPMGDPHWSSLFLKDCTSWKGATTLEQFLKSCSPWKGLALWKFIKNSSMGATPHWSKGRVWSVLILRKKKWQRQCVMN